jgi:hypothetical protein
MPTMVERQQCCGCHALHETREIAESCARGHGHEEGYEVVKRVDVWECDGDGCQALFEDQWTAQACETSHEIGTDDGRQKPFDSTTLSSQWMEAFTS